MMGLICNFFNWIRSFFWTKEVEVSVLGLQKSGKTCFVDVLANSPFKENYISTVGCNVKRIRKGLLSIKTWDFGGSPRFRVMWKRYCRGVDAIVYIVDAADVKKLKEAKHELHLLLESPQLDFIPVLILGNKTDLPDAIGKKELVDHLDLIRIVNREVHCYMVSCKNKDNIDLILEWLTAHAKKSN